MSWLTHSTWKMNPYQAPNQVLQLGNRFLGEEIGYQRPAVLRFKIVGFYKVGFAHIEATVIFVIFIPLVLRVVDLVVCGRVSKVELTEIGTRGMSMSVCYDEAARSPRWGRSGRRRLGQPSGLTRRLDGQSR